MTPFSSTYVLRIMLCTSTYLQSVSLPIGCVGASNHNRDDFLYREFLYRERTDLGNYSAHC